VIVKDEAILALAIFMAPGSYGQILHHVLALFYLDNIAGIDVLAVAVFERCHNACKKNPSGITAAFAFFTEHFLYDILIVVLCIFFIFFPHIKVIAKEEKIAEIGIAEFLRFCEIADFYARQEFVGTRTYVMLVLSA
jgi:hypothetical protein